MNPQRLALLAVIVACFLDLLGNPMRRRPSVELKILIKARKSPQLAEGLIRYLVWDLALRRGIRVGIGLAVEGPGDEPRAICAALLRDGLLEGEAPSDPDLVFVI